MPKIDQEVLAANGITITQIKVKGFVEDHVEWVKVLGWYVSEGEYCKKETMLFRYTGGWGNLDGKWGSPGYGFHFLPETTYKLKEDAFIIKILKPSNERLDRNDIVGTAIFISQKKYQQLLAQQREEQENERKTEEEKREVAELERQNKIQSYPLMTHVDAFLKRLDELPAEEVKGDKEQKLVALYFKLKQVLESNGQLSLEERELLGDHYLQGAEFDAVLKMWNDKIAKAKADPTLDEQQRKLTIGHLMAMMNKALQRLQED